MDAVRGKTYFWDFFGPRANGTALHFQKHLEQFLGTHGLVGCEIGLSSEADGHHAVFCVAARDAEAVIERALRPRRVAPAS